MDARRLAGSLRGDLDWIVLKALEKERGRRYETASGVAREVERYLQHEPVEARAPSRAYRLRKLVRRNRGTFAAITTIVLLLVGSAAVSSISLASATSANEVARRELKRANEVKRIITEMLASVDPAFAADTDTTLLRGILDDTARRLLDGSIEDELIAAELNLIIGRAYLILGRHPEAEAHLPAALEISERRLGPEHPDAIRSKSSLAMLRLKQGRYELARTLAEAASETARRAYGPEHVATVTAEHDLVKVYLEARVPERAGPAIEELGGDTDLFAMEARALMLSNQRQFDEAERLYLELIETQNEVLGRDHPRTLQSLHNLAVQYLQLRDLEKGQKLLDRALEGRRRVLGDEHVDTLETELAQANVYAEGGRMEEAAELLEHVFVVRERNFGRDHRATLRALSGWFAMLHHLGRAEEALALGEECVAGLVATVGEEQPETVTAMQNLGKAYGDSEQYEDSLFHLERAFVLAERVFGADAPPTVHVMGNVVYANERLGRIEDALALQADLTQRLLRAADRPGLDPKAVWQVAWNMLDNPTPELFDPERALKLAQLAVELTDGQDMQSLQTLGRALFESGDITGAIETQERALELVPLDASYRGEYEDNLERYRAAAIAKTQGR